MRSLFVKEKTGFRIKNPNQPLVIRDFRGTLFYTNEAVLPKVKSFNMPGLGQFYIDKGDVIEMEYPIVWTVPKLPPTEIANKDPFNFSIVFDKNPNKATIIFEQEKIILDNMFLEVPLPKLYYVVYHEFAHQYYVTEKYADLLACNYMLKKGFNPEQIGEAQILTLSDRQYERKCEVVNHLIEVQHE